MKKTFTLALGIVAGLYLASTLYNASPRRSENQTSPPNKKLTEGEPEEFSLWI
jgi:hypothetical protein